MPPAPHASPPHDQRPTYSSSFHPGHHVWLSRKNYKAFQQAKNTPGSKIQQASEPDVAGTVEGSGLGFETALINMLRAQMDKVDST